MSEQDGTAAGAPSYEAVPDDVLPEEHLTALEAVLMVIDEPVPAADLASVLGLPTGQVTELLTELAAEYRGERGGRARGFELREVGGGWRIFSAPSHADVVGRFVLDGQTAKLTQASLETLAVIAYRQPVTRGRISAIRGVNVDGVVRTLLARGLVEEAGPDEEGGAMRYRTSAYFLERMGLTSLEDLPPLAPYLPDMGSLDDIDGEFR
ncbi:condensin subunit ScpB [Georgenia soli]|uniref:Condensin subunit ScpB n=1 Tax=Georgenia soli TaxID=638953 RepID=A0A2A9EIQ4_9MICO|nr:SMC-Scp complex subunit ScpB [Georgenia soli]PFG38129.1 condensin subunit ScpB [Georgenia soli]